MSVDREAVVSYGNEELALILKHFTGLLFDSDALERAKEQWLRLKLFVCKRVPLHEREFHILWPKILKEDKRFSTIMRLISIVKVLPMNTAACERGFSLMNRIKSKGRARLKNSVMSSLMCISANGEELESFDPQPAVNNWSSNACQRPGNRKLRKDRSTSDDSDTDDRNETDFISDAEIVDSEDEQNYDFCIGINC